MPLSDAIIKNTKPSEKSYKLSDGKGMYLLVQPNGSKYFRLDYRYTGLRKTLALGVYPDVSLKLAREKRNIAKNQLNAGIDPCLEKKIKKNGERGNTFKRVALEWFEKQMSAKSVNHRTRVLSLFERDLFPYLGVKPIAALKAPELLTVLQRIEKRGAMDTGHRALQLTGQVLRFAEATGRVERDISQALKGALIPATRRHFSSQTEPEQVKALLNTIDSYSEGFVVKSALKLAPLVFVRPRELRQAEWTQIDLAAREWRYQVTKTNKPHLVPLSRQAVEILTQLHTVTGRGRFVFACERTPNGSHHVSDTALLAALRRLGIGKEVMTIHGFRAMARTLLDEKLGFRPDFIEHQLAHTVKEHNGRAYNRTSYLPERVKMMQAWADYLDNLKHS